jgi:hypothetical protein
MTEVIDVSFRSDIKLGQRVKEKVTGFEGTVVTISHEMDGSILMGVQPRELENGKPQEAWEFDIERLIPMGEEAILNKQEAHLKDGVKLGAIYEDIVTGAVGTAVRLIEFLGGCCRITLRPRVDKDGKHLDSIMIPLSQTKIVDETPAAETEKKKTRSGGPGTSERKIMSRMAS